MFLGKKRSRPRNQQSKRDPEIQKPQKRQKYERRKNAPSNSFSFSDSLLTSHLFSSLTPFIAQLGTELKNEDNLTQGSEIAPPPPPLWEDEFSKEMKIETLPEDPVQSKLLKFFVEKNQSQISNDKDQEEEEEEEEESVDEDVDDDEEEEDLTKKRKMKKRRLSIPGNVYEDSLRSIYSRYHPTPKWYQKEQQKEKKQRSGNSSHDFLNSTKSIIEKSTSTTIHKFRKLQNLNIYEYPSSAYRVLSVSFHPTTSLSAVVSSDRVVRVYRVDGTDNPLVHKFSKFRTRLSEVHFSKSGNELIITTKNSKQYYITDLKTSQKNEHFVSLIKPDRECPSLVLSHEYFVFYGSGGNAYCVSAKTNRLHHIHRTNGKISSCCFCRRSKYLFISTIEGRIHVFDVNGTGRPLNIVIDASAVRITKISVSHEYLATGSDSGVVTIYPLSSLIKRSSSRPKPFKTLMNLTTKINYLEFSNSGGILCCGSSAREDQVRLFRCPSFRCYEKFPNFGKYGKRALLTFEGAGFSGNEKWFFLMLKRRVYLYSVNSV